MASRGLTDPFASYNNARNTAIGAAIGGTGLAAVTYGHLKYKTTKAQRMKRKYAKQRKAREAYEASQREGQQHLAALNSGKLDHLVGKSWKSSARNAGRSARRALTHRRAKVQVKVDGKWKKHPGDRTGRRLIRRDIEHDYNNYSPRVAWRRNRLDTRPAVLEREGHQRVKYARLPVSAEVGLAGAGAAGAYGVHRKVKKDMSVPLSQISKMKIPLGKPFEAFRGHSKLARQRGAVQSAAAKVRANPGSARARKRLARKTDRYMATSARTSGGRTKAADSKWGRTSGHNRDDYLTDKRTEFHSAHGQRRALAASQGDDWLS